MSVKVAVRVRPYNQREKERESSCVIEMNGKSTIIKDELGQEKTFSFDYSFWSHDGFTLRDDGYAEADDGKYADQRQVFDCVGKEILDNAWEGYHCCLFAYGQTGSGKSYSMVGYGSNKGIVPISCDEIFKRIKENTDPEKSYEVQVSMLEIYNEKVQDLLTPASKRPPSGLKIRESKTIGVFVEGLTKHPVTSYEEISKKMDEGYENRTIGSTLMNATSSRAHTIVTIEFKQINFVAGKKSEKLSMINLVDLAGSERSSSTGATGARLIEGCNINKSLLVLGNVINVLADKALGKKKDALPPYRDSALTRILQNALGGNSKTVMICALSPASINYEETLSTLRYADRAKKIQNKAVVNESEHDKMVRMLKEENLDLKRMIEDLNRKILGGGGIIGEDDKKAFLDLKEQYEANSKVMEEMQKSFSDKLEEAKIREKETLGEKVDISAPHLVVLNEDPQLSHKLRYSLKDLPVYVGRKHGNPSPQITLSGIGIKVNHALFKSERGGITLRPNEPDAKEFIFINGKKVQNGEGQLLKHKDRITFGTNTILLFMNTSTGMDIFDVDWESAQMELQKEIEENNKLQEEANEKKKQEELDNLKKDLEEKYSKEKQEIEEKLRRQLQDYELKLKEMNQSVEKSKVESERINVEFLIKQRIDLLEAEKARKKREVELRERNDMIRKENIKKGREFAHSSEKLESQLNNMFKKLNKMKIIMTELKRNINMEIFLSKNLLDHFSDNKNASTNLLIRVENYEEGTVYYWNTETFQNRYDLMKELFDRFNDEDFDIFNLKNEDDPIWDEPKPTLLGYTFYKLEPLAYLMSNPTTSSIISPNGLQMGSLNIDIIPHDDDNNEYEEIPEDPSELIGQPLNFRVYIKEGKDLPENFCRGVQVEYTSFHDNVTYKTDVFEEKSTNIEFEKNFEHHIEYLTRDDIEYITKEKVRQNIY
jgi:kinesin family member 13